MDTREVTPASLTKGHNRWPQHSRVGMMLGRAVVCRRVAVHLKCRSAAAFYHSKTGVYGNRLVSERQPKESCK